MDYMVAVEDLWAFSKGKMLGQPNPSREGEGFVRALS